MFSNEQLRIFKWKHLVAIGRHLVVDQSAQLRLLRGLGRFSLPPLLHTVDVDNVAQAAASLGWVALVLARYWASPLRVQKVFVLVQSRRRMVLRMARHSDVVPTVNEAVEVPIG